MQCDSLYDINDLPVFFCLLTLSRSQRAYICNFRQHWFCVRKIGNQWFNLNSLLTGPELISNTYLSLFLTQLQQEGWTVNSVAESFWVYIYEPVTKGRDLKWDTLPQNQTPSKLFSVLPLESGMFQVTISIIKKWFWSKCVLYGIKTGVMSGVDVCNNGHSECHNNTEKNHLYAILMLLVHLSSC